MRIREAGTIEAAVALVLTEGTRGADLLMIKRSAVDGDPWSGQMALPGGRRDAADENLLDTARREAREETGVRLYPGHLLGELDDLRPQTPTLPPVVVRPFVFGLATRPAIQTNHEVALHLWVPLADLATGSDTREVMVRGERCEVPAYVVGEHVIWGMTRRILMPIIGLVKK